MKTFTQSCAPFFFAAILPFDSLASEVPRAASVTPGAGTGLAPLLARALPAIPLEIIAALVAAANAFFVVVLAGLGTTVAVRLFRRWQRSRRAIGASHSRQAALRPRPRSAPLRGPSPGSATAQPAERASLGDEARVRRIRDRFIQVRFDGALEGVADFAHPGKVVKAARLYFEDNKGLRADEMLVLALRHYPEEKAYWLARLEIQFLLGERDRFVEVADAFRKTHPGAPEWELVRRLGARVAPGVELFAAGADIAIVDDHYGPWPDTPNWIQSSWDLTAEVIAAEFHHRMRTRIERLREDYVKRAELATR
jgi:hypothetical protein